MFRSELGFLSSSIADQHITFTQCDNSELYGRRSSSSKGNQNCDRDHVTQKGKRYTSYPVRFRTVIK